MENAQGFDVRLHEVNAPKPVCYLRWGEGEGHGMTISIYRDFNWFQRKMLKWCFGLYYLKNLDK